MYGSRRTFWIIAIVAAILVVVFGIIIFRPVTKSNNTSATTQSTKAEKKFTDYIDENSFVRMSVDGNINAQENHRQIRITVSPTKRTIDVFQGYNYDILKTEEFDNTQAAYSAFMNGLNHTGFSKKRTKQPEDFAGVCPLTTRTIYELFNDDSRVNMSWTASCGGTVGTFGGNVSNTTQLFKNQIPNYNDFTAGVKL